MEDMENEVVVAGFDDTFGSFDFIHSGTTFLDASAALTNWSSSNSAILQDIIIVAEKMKAAESAALTITALRECIPGLQQKVTCPACKEACSCVPPCEYVPDQFLWDLIIHLNDRHKWARENIADWLDTLDVDLAFQTTNNNEEK